MENQTRVAIYLRVSTDEQVEKWGLPMQEEKLRSFVSLHDFQLSEQNVYREEGYSGSLDISERPALSQLFKDAQAGQFDLVIVLNVDRLFRDNRLLLNAVFELKKFGVKFRSATEYFDTSNPFGEYALNMMGAQAQFNRATIVERTQGGRKMAAKSGKWVWGPPPYGYRLDPKTKKLTVNQKEAQFVRKFFEWAVNDRLPLSKIQTKANDLKIPTYINRKRKHPELNGFWHKKTIARILTNSIYTGETHFYRFKKGKAGLTALVNNDLQKDPKEWITFYSPEIISRALFEKCRDQLLKNREQATRNLKHSYLFNKILYCGSCGLKLFAGAKLPKNDNQRLHKFYHGLNGDKWQKVIIEGKRCRYCGDVAESRLEPIWDTIKGILEDPSYMLPKLAEYNLQSVGRSEIEVKMAEVEKHLEKLITSRRRLSEVYINNEEMDQSAYAKRMSKIKRDEERLKAELQILKQKSLQKAEFNSYTRTAKEMHDVLKARLKSSKYEDKSFIIHQLVNKITLYKRKNEAEVELNFPNWSPVMAGGGSVLSDGRIY